MTPPDVAALRALVPVHDDKPGSLTALLARLERYWRESEAERERDMRLTRCELGYSEGQSDG